MINRAQGPIPIININAQNIGTGNFGEYLTLLNYKDSYTGMTFKNTSNLDIDQRYQEIITSTFKSNRVTGDSTIIKTSTRNLSTKDLRKNDVKYITIIPIRKEMVLPTPEEMGKANPQSVIVTPEENTWFMANIIFRNASPIMNKNASLDRTDSPEGIINKLDTDILFNVNIDLETGIENISNNSFQLLFRFKFSTNFLSTFFFNFEFLKNSLLKFLKDNKQKLLDIEADNNMFLSKVIDKENTIIKNILINEIKIKVFKTETYFNKRYFDNSKKTYKLTLKLIPQDYINLLDINSGKYLIHDNINNFFQSITNENTILFDKIFDKLILERLNNNTEEINIINIENTIELDDKENPDLEKIKLFLKNKLIGFLEDLDVFPFKEGGESLPTMKTIPTEISYNAYKNNSIIEIGKRQIILMFEKDIMLYDNGIYSKIFVIQYNINENRLEFIPIIDPKTYGIFQSDDISKSGLYNLKNIKNSFKLYNRLSKDIPNETVLDEYLKYTIFNNKDGLNKSEVSTKETKNNNPKANETNKYRLKIIKNYNLNQSQINKLLETTEEISSSSLTYSSYGLSTIYIS